MKVTSKISFPRPSVPYGNLTDGKRRKKCQREAHILGFCFCCLHLSPDTCFLALPPVPLKGKHVAKYVRKLYNILIHF